jgi:hypothetical protein
MPTKLDSPPILLDSLPMLGKSKEGESKDIKPSQTFVTLIILMDKKIGEFKEDVFLDSLRFAMADKDVHFLDKDDSSKDSVEVKIVSPTVPALRLLQKNDKLKEGKEKENIIQKFKDVFKITSIESPDFETYDKSGLYKSFDNRWAPNP